MAEAMTMGFADFRPTPVAFKAPEPMPMERPEQYISRLAREFETWANDQMAWMMANRHG